MRTRTNQDQTTPVASVTLTSPCDGTSCSKIARDVIATILTASTFGAHFSMELTMLYAFLGFLSFPAFVWTLIQASNIYYDWRYKVENLKRCPTCGTYVLNLKVT